MKNSNGAKCKNNTGSFTSGGNCKSNEPGKLTKLSYAQLEITVYKNQQKQFNKVNTYLHYGNPG
ncbi:MAG: hypothetical protein IPQ03_02955 [Bacteroidetes bacterium]|nr:hypothetical protein [Bacteroidota bacterium]